MARPHLEAGLFAVAFRAGARHLGETPFMECLLMQSFAKRQQASSAAAVVGVDAGKFEHTLVIRPRGGHDAKPFPFQTTRAGFESAVARIQDVSGGAPSAEVLVGIEFAGTLGFTLAQFLSERGYAPVNLEET